MKKEVEIILRPDIVQEIKWFVPVFGSDEDLRIVERISKMHKLLREVDNKRFRDAEKKKDTKSLTSKMKDIQRLEESLLISLRKRNEL